MKSATLVLFSLLFVNGLRAAPRQAIVPHVINGRALVVQHAAAVFAVVSENGDGFFGGGSIVSDRHIITGANLVLGATSVRVGYGSTSLTSLTAITTTSFVAHAAFNRTTMENDIAIVFLPFANRIEFSDAVRAIALPTAAPGIDLAGSLGGFGFTESNGVDWSDTLLVASLITVDNAICTERWPSLTMENQFCANGAPSPVIPSLITNICAGDYGAGFYTGDGFITTTTTTTTTTEDPGEEEIIEVEPAPEEDVETEDGENQSGEVQPFDPTKLRSASVSEGEEQVEPVLVGIASVVGDWWECNPEDPRTYTIVFNYVSWIQDLTGIEV
ncbi:trypsin, alkaline A-like [Bradysia coprophila]|uniref:trypsin, alkaline A-like n=1 Tax=Bradysia coprophila TaxID=38358 RepID=UPI00187DD0C4|nr:trypsin, alkaline A-like [Bradysia coprophila]